MHTQLVDISERECYAIARKITKECNKAGDGIVLNFNGVHSSIVIKTDSGLAYFHYPTPWETEKSSVYLNQKEDGSIKQEHLKERVIWELKEDIKFYKSHTLNQQMVKLSGLDTKQMIEHFIDIDNCETFHRLSHNCATVTAKILKIGLPPEMMHNLSEDISFVFPSSVHWFAKQTKHKAEEKGFLSRN